LPKDADAALTPQDAPLRRAVCLALECQVELGLSYPNAAKAQVREPSWQVRVDQEQAERGDGPHP
jgi:hypothetical protein